MNGSVQEVHAPEMLATQASKNGKKTAIAGESLRVATQVVVAPKARRTAAKKNGAYRALDLLNGSANGSKNTNGSANGSHRTNGSKQANGLAAVNGVATKNGGILAKAAGDCHEPGANGAPVIGGASLEKISRSVLQDRELVNRCLARETGAWSQMYARFHSPLIASVRAFLGSAGRDLHLVEEIAARVWYALVRDEFWLLGRFDVERGCRLSTFLSLIAKAQARLLLRSERRRRTREHAVARYEIESPGDNGLYSLSGEEFVATLSPAERRFLVDVLVASADRDAKDRYSSQNLWQLRRRVREKLLKFLE